MDLKRLLDPRKIAIVGASEKEGFGGDTCRNIMTYMTEDTYYFVNPKWESVFGKKCYTSLTALPDKIDLVVICTSAKTVEPILIEAHGLGVGGAVVYASGYSEIGTEEGRKAEQSLIDLCKRLNMALLGPNCAGYMNFASNITPFAFISDQRDRRGAVGVVSQSGQLALSMMDSPKMKFSYAISTGNGSVCSTEDYLDFLVEDPDTKVVAMYLEGVKNTQKFVDTLKRAALKRKPIVILKTGRSEKGKEIAASHTGSLSGADQVFEALFKKFGVIRVDDLEELMSTALALSVIKNVPKLPTVASMNLSGGETGICADLGELYNIDFPDFSKNTIDELNRILPSYATPNNPLDMTASLSYDVDRYAEALEIVMNDPAVGLVAVGYTLLNEIADPAIHYMTRAMERVCLQEGTKPIVMIPFAENTRNMEYSERLENIGVPVLPSSRYAFKIIKNIMDFVAYDFNKVDLNVQLLSKTSVQQVALSESESKAIVAQYGIPFPKTVVVGTAARAVAVAMEMGFPLVAKIDSPDILHKSDAGCVKLNLNSDEQVHLAFEEIIENAKCHYPLAQIDGVQISQMIEKDVEMIIGVKNDPQFGPCILCGLGGVFVEIFKDSSLRLAPVNYDEAMDMILSLKGAKILQGYRGGGTKDIHSLAEAIVNVSNLACEHKEQMSELDINPIFIYEKGVCAVDALYVKNNY